MSQAIRRISPIVAVALLALSACSMPGSKETSNTSTQNANTTTATPTPNTTPPPTTSPAVVLAPANSEWPSARLEVNEMKRGAGDTVTVRFTIVNDADVKLDIGGYALCRSGGEYASVDGMSIVDPAGKKKYLVIADTDGKPLCSRQLKDVPPKTRVSLWAKLPAPPAGVDKVSVMVPHFDPLDDVPLS